MDCLTFCSRYLPDRVKTRFSRYQTEDDESSQIEGDDFSPLFPRTGHPIGSKNKRKGKTFHMEHHEWFEAHRYVLFNTGDEQVETFINILLFTISEEIINFIVDKHNSRVDSHHSTRAFKRKQKNKKKKTFATPGSLSFLANKKRRLLTTNEIIQAIDSEKGQLLKLIEEQQLVAPQPEANRQSVEEQPLEEEVVEDQLQMNYVTPSINEQPEEQGEGLSTKNTRGPIKMPKVHARKEHRLITLNGNNQPVGPTDEVVTELSGFLGTSKMSKTNTENRKKLMNPHTAGKKSFALVRNKLEKDKEAVSQKDVFVATRVRKPGRVYKATNENTISKIAEMEEIEKEMSVDGQSVDAFSVVMGPEHLGRLRLYGAGVTKTSLKKKNGNSAPASNASNDVVQQMQERMQKMEKQMEDQKRTMRQELIADVIAQLKHAGLIDPIVLAALSVPSPTEATFAQAADQGDEIVGEERSTEDLA